MYVPRRPTILDRITRQAWSMRGALPWLSNYIEDEHEEWNPILPAGAFLYDPNSTEAMFLGAAVDMGALEHPPCGYKLTPENWCVFRGVCWAPFQGGYVLQIPVRASHPAGRALSYVSLLAYPDTADEELVHARIITVSYGGSTALYVTSEENQTTFTHYSGWMPLNGLAFPLADEPQP